MRALAVVCLLALPACENALSVPIQQPDLAQGPEADIAPPSDASVLVDASVSEDMAHAPFDLAKVYPDLAPPPGLRFVSEASTDVVAVAHRDASGGDTLLALDSTGAATTVAYNLKGFRSGWARPNHLISVESDVGFVTWWPSLGAGGAMSSLWPTLSSDGLYLALSTGAGLLAGPRGALEPLPANCVVPRFAPITDHLYVRCGSDLYRFGKDQPVASAVRVAPGVERWWFSSDGSRVIVDTKPMLVASTALDSLDAVTLTGTASPDSDFAFFESVTPVPGRNLVEYVANGASGSTVREWNLSTNTVSVRAELDVSGWNPGFPHPWFGAHGLSPVSTSTWFGFEKLDGIQMFTSPYDWVFQVCLSEIDGTKVYCGGSGQARAPALLSSGAALFGAYVPPGVYAWTLVGPDLVERASTTSEHDRRAVPLDDNHFLMFDGDLWSTGTLKTCGPTGCVDTLPNPIVNDFRLEPTTRRLYYIQGGAVLTTTL